MGDPLQLFIPFNTHKKQKRKDIIMKRFSFIQSIWIKHIYALKRFQYALMQSPLKLDY